MTDNEIVKALEWYASKFKTVGFVYMDADGTHLIGTQDVLDLINRLQAENDMLRQAMQKISVGLDELKQDIAHDIKLAKAEAYKEFAERLHEELRIYRIKDKFNKSVFLNVVDKAKKEFVGDDNG